LEPGLHGAAVVVVAGIAPDGLAPVRGQRQEALDGRAARHVLDVGVEAAVLVDDQHGRERALARGLHEVAAHGAGAAAGRGVRDVPGLDALVGEGDRLRPRVARQRRLGHGQGRHAAHRDQRRPVQELAAVDAAVTVLVVQLQHPPVDLGLRQRRRLVVDGRPVDRLVPAHAGPSAGSGGAAPVTRRAATMARATAVMGAPF
jgi:hypothetical protein